MTGYILRNSKGYFCGNFLGFIPSYSNVIINNQDIVIYFTKKAAEFEKFELEKADFGPIEIKEVKLKYSIERVL